MEIISLVYNNFFEILTVGPQLEIKNKTNFYLKKIG